MKQTQLQWVKAHLDVWGEISRNQALANYCSRLGSRILDLKKEGYVFKTFSRETTKPDGTRGKDYIYQLISKPL